jgi:hypothetical protein
MGAHSRLGDDLPDEHEGAIPMLTATFWTGALDRAVKSFAQALLLLWGADQGFNVLQIDLGSAFGVAGGAAVLSLLTSIASSAVGDKGTSSALPGGS